MKILALILIAYLVSWNEKPPAKLIVTGEDIEWKYSGELPESLKHFSIKSGELYPTTEAQKRIRKWMDRNGYPKGFNYNPRF